jgi:hypothetical protein
MACTLVSLSRHAPAEACYLVCSGWERLLSGIFLVLQTAAAGHQQRASLFLPVISYVQSAADLLSKTDGDLAGWLGDLAPRGDLDSTQLLYRLAGTRLDGIKEICFGHDDDEQQSLAALVLPVHGLPLLALAHCMLQPGRKSSTAGSSRSSARNMIKLSFTEAWLRSPLTLKTFGSLSSMFDVTLKCTQKVGEGDWSQGQRLLLAPLIFVLAQLLNQTRVGRVVS